MSKFMKAMNATKSAFMDSSSQHNTIQSNPLSTPKIPFNLDEIFQADVDRFSKLKDVLKYILDNLEGSKIKMNEMETKMI